MPSDKVRGAARRSRPTSFAGSGSIGRQYDGVLRRLRQRGAVAAVPSGRRAAAVPQRGLGGVPGRQRPLRGGHRRGAAAATTRRCSSRTTTSRWSRSGCASGGRRRGPRCSGTSRGRIPIGCASARGGARSSTGLLANDLLAFQLERDRRNFVLAVEEELDAEIDADGAARFGSTAASRRVTAVPIGVDYDRIQTVGARPARSPSSRQRLRPAFGLQAPHHRPGRRSARLHEGHSRAARGARPRVHAPSRAARPAHVRADRRAVAVGARQLQRDRIRDRSQGRTSSTRGTACRGCRRRSTTTRRRSICPAWSRSTASRTSASSARCTTA